MGEPGRADAADDLIITSRLRLAVLDPATLDALATGAGSAVPFDVPPDWPDEDGLEHLERWRRLARVDGGSSPWRARGVIDPSGTFVGHAGCHGPPVPIETALDDPTFEGTVDPCPGGAVEIGYTILPEFRGRGYAVEAVEGLIDWIAGTGEVGAVIACVRPENAPSLAVLAKLGGFREIGRCRDGDDDELVLRRDV